MPETQQEVALAYLRKQGRSLDLSAMRKNLLAGGYDPAVVEQACLLYSKEFHPTGCWRTILGLSAALVLGAMALLALTFAVCSSSGFEKEHATLFLIASGLLAVLAVATVAAVSYSFFVRQK